MKARKLGSEEAYEEVNKLSEGYEKLGKMLWRFYESVQNKYRGYKLFGFPASQLASFVASQLHSFQAL